MLAFLLTFLVACATVIFFTRLRQGWRARSSPIARGADPPGRWNRLLQVLWRRRVLFAIGPSWRSWSRSRSAAAWSETRGLAQGQVLLDTKRSQLIDVRPVLVETSPWRASLLGKLLGTGARARIATRPESARRAGGDDSQLSVPSVPASLPRIAAEAAASPSDAYLLTVHSDAMVPLISLRGGGAGTRSG